VPKANRGLLDQTDSLVQQEQQGFRALKVKPDLQVVLVSKVDKDQLASRVLLVRQDQRDKLANKDPAVRQVPRDQREPRATLDRQDSQVQRERMDSKDSVAQPDLREVQEIVDNPVSKADPDRRDLRDPLDSKVQQVRLETLAPRELLGKLELLAHQEIQEVRLQVCRDLLVGQELRDLLDRKGNLGSLDSLANKVSKDLQDR